MSAGEKVVRALGAPLRVAVLGLIGLYRVTLGTMLGGQCRFHPSCSKYAEQAVRMHGAVKGMGLAMWRVLRCGPFSRGGADDVPPGRTRGRVQYEAIIPPGGGAP